MQRNRCATIHRLPISPCQPHGTITVAKRQLWIKICNEAQRLPRACYSISHLQPAFLPAAYERVSTSAPGRDSTMAHITTPCRLNLRIQEKTLGSPMRWPQQWVRPVYPRNKHTNTRAGTGLAISSLAPLMQGSHHITNPNTRLKEQGLMQKAC